MTEKELLVNIRRPSGDREYQEACRRLYEQHFAGLYNYLLKHDLPETEARDGAHQSLANIIEAIQNGSYREEAKISTYLFQSAKNLVKNYFRSESRRRARLAEYLQRVDQEADSPEYLYLFAEFRERLKALMGRLSENCSRLLQLRADNLSWEEVARQMGYQSAASVRVVAFRCRLDLKNLIRQELEPLN